MALFPSNAHEFAIYCPEIGRLSIHAQGIAFQIADKDIRHRLMNILRVQPEEQVILFDDIRKLVVSIVAYPQHGVQCLVLNAQTHKQLNPAVHWIVPLLYKEAFEEVVSFLTILGASNIYPIVTAKTHRRSWGTKEPERLHRIMVAAAEQSKQYIVPTVHSIVDWTSLPKILAEYAQATRLFFDPDGAETFSMIENLRSQRPASIVAMVGPEGDLTCEEKQISASLGFKSYALTPTILRSEHAVAVAMGIVRSTIR